MNDLIIITELRASDNTTVFNTYAVRLASDDALRLLMQGTPKPELPEGSVVYWEAISPTPKGVHSLGHGAPSTLDDAVGIVHAALHDPKNQTAVADFSDSTPIYIVRRGKLPELMDKSSDRPA